MSNNEKQAFIETRGEGGIVLAPPSSGYKAITGTIESIPNISEDQRENILTICKSYNLTNKLYKAKEKSNSKTHYNTYKSTPWEAYDAQPDHAFEVLQANGWEIVTNVPNRRGNIFWKRPGTDNSYSASWNETKGLFYVYTSNGAPFDQEAAYSPSAIFALLECGGDFSESTKRLKSMGFGVPWSSEEQNDIRKIAEYMKDGALFADTLSKLDMIYEDEDEKKIERAVISYIENKNEINFCKISDRGKVTILNAELRDYIRDELNIILLLVNDVNSKSNYIICKVDGQIITEISMIEIKNSIFHFVRKESDSSKIEDALIGMSKQRWEQIIEALGTTVINFLKDGRNESFHFFKNAVVKINSEGPSTINYSDLPKDKYIWSDQIIDHNFILDQDCKSELDTFLNNVTNHAYEAAKTIMGYLSTNYKDESNAFAIVISEDTDDNSKGGGTGKTLFVKFIQQIRNVLMLDGKGFDPSNRFVFQRVDESTDIIVLDDVNQNFKIEKLHNCITDGITIEKKNRQAYFIPFSDSPKMVVITNYDIDDHKTHVKRRIKRLYFSRHYSLNNNPEKEFGHRLINDWDAAEWNKFYNSIFEYIAMFFKTGIIENTETEEIKLKKLKARIGTKLGSNFIDFMDRFIKAGVCTFPKKKYCEMFKKDEASDVSFNLFKKWMREYFEIKGFEVEESRTIINSERLECFAINNVAHNDEGV